MGESWKLVQPTLVPGIKTRKKNALRTKVHVFIMKLMITQCYSFLIKKCHSFLIKKKDTKGCSSKMSKAHDSNDNGLKSSQGARQRTIINFVKAAMTMSRDHAYGSPHFTHSFCLPFWAVQHRLLMMPSPAVDPSLKQGTTLAMIAHPSSMCRGNLIPVLSY